MNFKFKVGDKIIFRSVSDTSCLDVGDMFLITGFKKNDGFGAGYYFENINRDYNNFGYLSQEGVETYADLIEERNPQLEFNFEV